MEADVTGKTYKVPRDERFKFMKRVPGEYSNHIYSCRLTDKEWARVERARAMGIDPRDVLLKALKEVVDESE